MFERISASFDLARSSWRVLRTDKQLIVFPIISGLCCLLVTISFSIPFLANPQILGFLNDDGNGVQVPWWVYVVAFAFYFCNYFVIIFFNSALISCALIRFNGETPTLSDGLNAAASRLPQILAWSLVSATVGVILKAIENAHEKAGLIISALLGTAWSIMTYFVVPVLVVEKVGPIAAIRRSIAILRKTWGEALIGNLGIGLFVFLLAVPGILLLVAGAVLLASAPPALGIAVIVLAVLYLVLLSAAGAALNGIFLSALYQYAAQGAVPADFDRQSLEHAFQSKK
jgi:hypothetical protein